MKKRIQYEELTPDQQETYNFQKLAGILADYGYNCVRLADNWHGADFLAYHIDRTQLWVQLKGRMTIDKKYLGWDLYIAFPDGAITHGREWFLIPHDELVALVGKAPMESMDWKQKGKYSWPRGPNKEVREKLARYQIGQETSGA